MAVNRAAKFRVVADCIGAPRPMKMGTIATPWFWVRSSAKVKAEYDALAPEIKTARVAQGSPGGYLTGADHLLHRKRYSTSGFFGIPKRPASSLPNEVFRGSKNELYWACALPC